jgi:hypothetical protein
MAIFAHQTIKVELYHPYVVVGVVGINMGGGGHMHIVFLGE